MKRRRYSIVIISGIVLSFLMVGSIYIMDRGVLSGERVTFLSEENINLKGTYYSGEKSAGIMFLEGFGSSQVAMKGMLSEFADWDINLFTFDFSGHSESDGVLGFDNAETDVIAQEILTAKEKFKQLSGLSDNQIILIGHSMGARCAMQATMFDPNPVLGMVLLGSQINLDTNVQASFFTGVSDTDLDWVTQMNATNPASNILLVSGSWDDILTPANAQLLLDKLEEGGLSGYNRSMEIVPRVFHNYEIYSARIMRITKSWVADQLSLTEVSTSGSKTITRAILWVFSLVVEFFTLIFAYKYHNTGKKRAVNSDDSQKYLTISNKKKFMASKVWLWGPSLILTLIMVMIFQLIPIGQPVFNLYYVGFIGAYGILHYFLYRRGKMPGISGKLAGIFKQKYIKTEKKDWLVSAAIAVGLLVFIALFSMTGWFYVYPLNRFFWLTFFTLITSFGFIIGHVESEIDWHNFTKSKRNAIGLNLIGFFPFFILLALYIAISSYSGMLGNVHGWILLAYVSLGGKIIYKLSGNPLFTGLMQALILQMMVLPQGVLFGSFFS